MALFALALLIYQASRALVIGRPSTAFENAAGIINWEKSSGLFVETSIQQWVLNHIQLAEALNYFYMYAHWTVTPLFFIWLYKRRGRVYPYVRNAFFAANGLALIVYMVYPVAPPRLMGAGDGFVDSLKKVSDIDLHGGVFAGWFNPHAAVPSMHFGYALMIGMVGLVLLRSWPLRLLALAYPAVVFLTITGTANHYVADAARGRPRGGHRVHRRAGRWAPPASGSGRKRGSSTTPALTPSRGATRAREMSSARSG